MGENRLTDSPEKQALRLIRSFMRIRDQTARKSVLAFAECLAGDQPVPIFSAGTSLTPSESDPQS